MILRYFLVTYNITCSNCCHMKLSVRVQTIQCQVFVGDWMTAVWFTWFWAAVCLQTHSSYTATDHSLDSWSLIGAALRKTMKDKLHHSCDAGSHLEQKQRATIVLYEKKKLGSCIRYQVSGTRYQVPGIMYQVSGATAFGYQLAVPILVSFFKVPSTAPKLEKYCRIYGFWYGFHWFPWFFNYF